MTYPALATIEDVEARLGQTVENPIQVSAFLDDASNLVRAYTDCDWVDDDSNLTDVPGGVVSVVAGMVVRVLQNPAGVTYEQTGPFGMNFGQAAAQRIYLSAQDKIILNRYCYRSPIGKLRTTRGDVETAGRDYPSLGLL